MATPAMVIKVAADASALSKVFSSMAPVLATTKSQLETASKAFDGSKIISQASAAVEGLRRLGGEAGSMAGVLKLTDSEQTKLNRTLDQAIQKYKALGSSAPAEMQALFDATKRVETGTASMGQNFSKVSGGLQSIAGAVGLSFGVGAVVGFATSVFDAASKVHDMSSALGLSAEAYQRFTYAAKQSGSSAEDFEKAIQKMNNNLAGGEKSTVESLKALGLSFASIRNMNPEEAFTAISDAVGKIEDPMTRARTAQELFGKGAVTMLPGMIEGYKKIGAGATVMSNDTVDRLEAAQDAWDDLKNKAIVASGEVIAAVMNVGKTYTAEQRQLAVDLAIIANQARGGGDAMDFLAEKLKHVSTASKDINLASDKTKNGLNELTAAQKLHIKTVEQLADTYTGKALADKVLEIAEAFDRAKKQGGILAQQLPVLSAELQKLRDAGATLPPRLNLIADAFSHNAQVIQREVKPVLVDWSMVENGSRSVNDLSLAFNRNVGSIQQGIDKLKQLGPTLKLQKPPLNEFVQTLDGIAGIVNGMSQAMGGWQGKVTEAIGTGISMWADYEASAHSAAVASSIAWGAATMGISAFATFQAAQIANFNKMKAQIADLRAELTSLGQTPVEFPKVTNKGTLNAAGKPGQVGRGGISGTAMATQIETLQKQLDDFKAAQETLNATMGRYGLSLDDVGTASEKLSRDSKKLVTDFTLLSSKGFSLEQITKGAASQLNDLIAAALKTGTKLDASLTPYIAQLLKSGGLTDELKNKLLGVADPVPWQDMQAAAEKYGISVKALGAQFEQAKLNDGVKSLSADWKLLVDNGADINAVMAGMQDEVSGFVDKALKMGLTIPASMKPIVEKMQEQGLLTDENGDKLKDLGDLKWADPVISDTDKLIAKLDELISKINGPGGLAAAFAGITFPDPTGGTTPKAHTGAIVALNGLRRYHSGAARVLPFPSLATDEFPAILQTGEAVLNRRAVANVGEPAIAAMNRGHGGAGGGVVVNHAPVTNIYAAPGMSEQQLADRVASAMQRNTNGLLTKVKRVVNG